MNKEQEFRKYIKDKMKDETVKMMVYACLSFDKQRYGLHELMTYTRKHLPEVYDKIPFTRYLICGWADDLTRMFSRCFPDFDSRFGTGITVGKIIEITNEEMFG